MHAVAGKVLHVDLSSGECRDVAIPDEIYKNYLSGMGLGAWYLSKHIPKGADPLGPDNLLGLTSGLLTGTGALMSGRFIAMAKSPLTGGWGDANAGGFFAPAIKQCGYDALFFSGVSPKPVYLFIDNSGPKLLDASEYWGLDAVEAEEKLIKKHWLKKRPQAAVIGTAGEKLSLIAGISTDGGRMAARSGVGAVMGSKRLKAVVLAGTKQISCADPARMKQLSQKLGKTLKKIKPLPVFPGALISLVGKLTANPKYLAETDGMTNSLFLKQFGTAAATTLYAGTGESPIKNWGGSREDLTAGFASGFNPSRVAKREFKKYHCYSCALGCGGVCSISDVKSGEFSHTHKPEYESIQAFGGLLLSNDLDAVFYINELLNRAAMDTISAGTTVAFAVECFENGIITAKDTGGLELRWGDSEAIIKLVKMMISREGFGDILADGTKRAAERIGRGAERFAVNVGGQEPGLHDARLDPLLGAHFTLDATPGKHTRGNSSMYSSLALSDICSWAPPYDKHERAEDYKPSKTVALRCVANSCYTMLVDALGGCMYAEHFGTPYWNPVELANAATGETRTGDDYIECGKRIQTTRQLFNAREGVPAGSFKLPRRLAGDPPLTSGPNKGKTLKDRELISLCFEAFGWDKETGVPTDETVKALGIDALMEVQP